MSFWCDFCNCLRSSSFSDVSSKEWIEEESTLKELEMETHDEEKWGLQVNVDNPISSLLCSRIMASDIIS